jgi:exopolyphosphatase / guanosine-5'-triphosphate,3'-diphosphate pyrophosphatase
MTASTNPIDSPTLAAVDLGSNSFHLIVAKYEHGQLQVIDRLREMVQLAAGLDDHGDLDPDARTRAVACLERFGQRVRGIPFAQVRALGTNTLRKLRAPLEFLAVAEQALGHPIEVISAHEEARLVYLGVAHGVATSAARRLVVDVGGGSTEFIVGEGFEPLELGSVSAGCVSISKRFFGDGKLTRSRFREAEMMVAVEFRPLRRVFRGIGWSEVVGSSGTIRTAERVIVESGWATSGITLKGLKRIRRVLEETGTVADLSVPGLSEERRAVFPGGVAILLACFRNLEIGTMNVSDAALREGALHDLVGRVEHHDPRQATVAAMAARYRVDEEQAARVCRTALDAFDQVSGAWELLPPHRELLEWAGRLHEIGLSISHTDYHLHGAYLAEHSSLSGFSREEQRVLSVLIGGHRRRLDIQIFDTLPKRLVVPTKRICALLRLSIVLHRSRIPNSRIDARWRITEDGLDLAFPYRWLSGHPLTRADLASEKVQLDRLGIELSFDNT